MALTDYWNEHGKDVASPDSVETSLKHLFAFFGDWPVADIGVEECRDFLQRRRAGSLPTATRGGVSDSTVRRDMLILSAAINHAVLWKRLKADEKPILEMPAAPPPRTMWLYKDELERLMNAASGRTADFIQIAYYTAGRRGSIEKLTKFQVSLEQNRISLHRPGGRITKKRRPSVPIVPALRPTIERCLRESTTEYLLGHGGRALPGFYVALRKAGLEWVPEREMRGAGKPTPHALRHSRATHLLQDGVDPWAVAQLLGDRLETVTAVYAHWCGDYLERALSKATEIG